MAEDQPPADGLSERLYGSQASAFDAKRGLAEVAPDWIARALVKLLGQAPTRVLELGAGTGEIGVALAARAEHYVGVEASQGMAERWRQRFASHPELSSKSALEVQDADQAWPAEANSVDLVFASRSAHWFEPGHLRAELARVSRPGTCFVLGRVVRSLDHPRRWLRREVHRALRVRGLEPKDGPRRGGELLYEIAHGDPRTCWIPRQAVLRWGFSAAPAEILDGWRAKPSLAGLELPAKARAEVLDEVSELANQRFGGLETELACSEEYAIEGVQFAPQGAAREPILGDPFPIRLASRFGPILAVTQV
ncbi:MAG: methyltransferase domain-containing protein [Polyangiaceae bacterium]|nr:methyltransferase domain-containing protein [Polyangiaceae bacterium]